LPDRIDLPPSVSGMQQTPGHRLDLIEELERIISVGPVDRPSLSEERDGDACSYTGPCPNDPEEIM
jgi:hypothetical protein